MAREYFNCGDLFVQDLRDGKEPQVMAYDGPNCTMQDTTKDPLKLEKKGTTYGDMYDVALMGDDNLIPYIQHTTPMEVKSVLPNSIKLSDARSFYIPPHMEADYTTAPAMGFGANVDIAAMDLAGVFSNGVASSPEDAAADGKKYSWKSIDGTMTYAGANDGQGGYNDLRDPNFVTPTLTSTDNYGLGTTTVNDPGAFTDDQLQYIAVNLGGADNIYARVDTLGTGSDYITGNWLVPDAFVTDNAGVINVVNACCESHDPICTQLFPDGYDCSRRNDPTMWYHYTPQASHGWKPHHGIRTLITRMKKPWATFRKDCCAGDAQALGFANNTADAANACGIFWGPTDTDGTCDPVIEDWCHWNSSSEYCKCVTSSMANPQCWDPTCSLSTVAYKNKAQKAILAQHCPAENVCTQTIGEGDNSRDNIMNNVVMIQDCQSALNKIDDGSPDVTGPFGRMCWQYFQMTPAQRGAITVDPVMKKECEDNYNAIYTNFHNMTCNGGTCDISVAAERPAAGTWPSGFPAANDPAWSTLDTANSAATDSVGLEMIIILTFCAIFLTAVYVISSIRFLTSDDDSDVVEKVEKEV